MAAAETAAKAGKDLFRAEIAASAEAAATSMAAASAETAAARLGTGCDQACGNRPGNHDQSFPRHRSILLRLMLPPGARTSARLLAFGKALWADLDAAPLAIDQRAAEMTAWAQRPRRGLERDHLCRPGMLGTRYRSDADAADAGRDDGWNDPNGKGRGRCGEGDGRGSESEG